MTPMKLARPVANIKEKAQVATIFAHGDSPTDAGPVVPEFG